MTCQLAAGSFQCNQQAVLWPQVYIAKLKNGEKVVVKVQRPGLKALFDIDLKNIRWVWCMYAE